MHNYKALKVWQKSRTLVTEIYKVSSEFPPSEQFGLTSQIRRAVISISNNIVEGSGRGTTKDFKRFLDIAFSSAIEVENLLILAYDLQMIMHTEFKRLTNLTKEIQRMIYGFKQSL